MMRNKDFATDYGVLIQDGPLAGLTARAVLCLAADDQILHTQMVEEIAQEPDYEAAMAAFT
jgi:thiol peroxidase